MRTGARLLIVSYTQASQAITSSSTHQCVRVGACEPPSVETSTGALVAPLAAGARSACRSVTDKLSILSTDAEAFTRRWGSRRHVGQAPLGERLDDLGQRSGGPPPGAGG